MAKKMKKFLALVLALTLCLVQIAIPVTAAGPNKPSGNNQSGYEYYIINVQAFRSLPHKVLPAKTVGLV